MIRAASSNATPGNLTDDLALFESKSSGNLRAVMPVGLTIPGGPDVTFDRMGQGEPRRRGARNNRLRRAGAKALLLKAGVPPNDDLRNDLGRTPVPAESNPGHGIRARHGRTSCLRRLRGREERRRQGAREA